MLSRTGFSVPPKTTDKSLPNFSLYPLLLIIAFSTGPAFSQTMTLEEYEPRSTLVVPEHEVTHAQYPFVDVHCHIWEMTVENLDSIATAMDSLNMAVMVNLSGRGFYAFRDPAERDEATEQAFLKQGLEKIQQHHPDRFIVFTNLNFHGISEPDWSERAVRQLEEDVRLGAKGLKVYKDLGLTLKDKNGARIPVDDPRFDPVWDKCGELSIPVLIHTGEPIAFWKPKDKHNERWLELKMFPQRYRDPDVYPSWEQVMGEQHNVFRKHPNTIFINAHLGWMGNDLARLGKLLDECPNVYTEIGAVLYEIGRQPRFAKKWFVKYQDRVLFGKDITHDLSEYLVYFRTLETADEYIKYYRKRHAFWRLYGLDLPDVVLRKLYYENAIRIIPGIEKSRFQSK